MILSGPTIRVVEVQRSGAWQVIKELPNREGAVSPDGRRLATLDEDTRRLTVTDLESGQDISRIVVEGRAGLGLFWSPKGTYLVAHTLFGFAVLGCHSLASVFSLDAGDHIVVEDLSVSADESRLAGTDRGGSTTVWDIKAKRRWSCSGRKLALPPSVSRPTASS